MNHGLHFAAQTMPAWVMALLSISFASLATAQAPDTFHAVYQYTHQMMGVSVTSEVIYIFRTDGTFTRIYHKSTNASHPELPVSGTFPYLKTDDNSAVLTITPAGATTSDVHQLTFTSPTAGSHTQTFGGGEFRVTPLPLTNALVNTSQRSWVSQAEPGIIGFVVPDGPALVVLVRAVGPGLAAFPGTTPALDPDLEVYAGPQRMWANDDWERNATEPDVVAGFRETVAAIGEFVGAFPLAPGSKDAAIVLFLPPGNYTVQVRNAAGEPRAEVLGEVYVIH